MRENHFQLGDSEYLRFQQFVSKHSGLQFPEKKRSELEKGILEALQNAPHGITNVESYFAFLNQSNNRIAQLELERLINILTIGETHFFRNTAQFEALANHVLPALIAKKREAAALKNTSAPGVPQLRIWSAGCSTGEEPYSIAMLLRELIPDIESWRIFILGTDINANSLARAREAVYRDWSFRETEARTRRPIYFEQEGPNFRLRHDIRRQVIFSQHNLIEDNFPSPQNGIMGMDLILCRNVTIYFSQEITQWLIKRFYETLVDDGWFLVGHSEPCIMFYNDFLTHSFPKAILYQKSKPVTPPLEIGKGTRKSDSRVNMPIPSSRFTDQHITQKLKQATAKLNAAQTGFVSQPVAATSRLNSKTGLQIPHADAEKSIDKKYEEAELRLVQGKVEIAIQLLESLLAENENYVPAYSLLARAYADLGQCLQARSWCQRALKIDSLNPKVYYILALLDENDALLGQAIENFKKMIYIDPQNPLPHFHLAVLYRKEGQADLSRRALVNAIKILQGLPKEQILPESGESAGWLLQTAKDMMKEWR